MSYISNENFPWGMHSGRDPITNPPLNQPQQGEVRSTSKGGAKRPSLIPVSFTYRQRKITTPLGSMSTKALISSLFISSAEKRLEAVRAIKAAGREVCLEAITGLQQALRDDSDAVRVAAAEALGTLGEYAPVKALMYALRDDPFWDVRAAAAQSLGKLGGQTPIQYLIVMLGRESDENVREAIVRALGRQEKAMPVDVLISVLYDDKNWLVREAAAWALGKLYREVPVSPLIYAFRYDKDESVRAAAARSLGNSCSPNVEEFLFDALEDESEDEEVHEAVAGALQQLDVDLYEIQRQGETYLLDETEVLFLQELFPDGSSARKKQSQIEQVFLALTQFISDKRGSIREANLLNTEVGSVLLMDCFYQNTESSLQETVFRSIKDTSLVEPIEAALKGQDAIVQEVVKQALETRKERPWFDLLVVSFALSHPSGNGKQMPLRVIMSGMGCQRVRESDTSVLDQIVDVWTDAVEEPPACEHLPGLADLKLWYHQPTSNWSPHGVAIA